MGKFKEQEVERTTIVGTSDGEKLFVILDAGALDLFEGKIVTVYVGPFDRRSFPSSIATSGKLECHSSTGQWRVLTPGFDGSYCYFSQEDVCEIRTIFSDKDGFVMKKFVKCGCADDGCGGAADAVIRLGLRSPELPSADAHELVAIATKLA